jgi:hypothetical protein
MPVSPPPPTGNCAARKKEKEGIFQDRCQHKKRERERERETAQKVCSYEKGKNARAQEALLKVLEYDISSRMSFVQLKRIKTVTCIMQHRPNKKERII